MRQYLYAAVAAAALGLAGAATAAPPAFDKAQGAGQYDANGCTILAPRPLECFPTSPQRTRDFSFTALQRGFGGRATGTFFTQNVGAAGAFRGRVTCLNVLGNTAVFAGILDEAPAPQPGFPSAVGSPFVVWVVDNGPPGGATPDLISPLALLPEGDPDEPLFPGGFPNVCPQPFPSLYGYFPVTSGNIVVEDQSAGIG